MDIQIPAELFDRIRQILEAQLPNDETAAILHELDALKIVRFDRKQFLEKFRERQQGNAADAEAEAEAASKARVREALQKRQEKQRAEYYKAEAQREEERQRRNQED